MVLKRRQVVKPGQEVFGSNPPAVYNAQDFYIGNQLTLQTFKYHLTDADEYALRYMELRPNEFPKSNVKLIMEKLTNALRPVYKDFVKRHMINNTIPVLTYRQFREAIKGVTGDEITEHEILTLARHYTSDVKIDPLPIELLRSIMQCELKRYLFNSFDRIEETFRYRDEKFTGKVSKDIAYSVLRGAKVPVDVELIKRLLDKMCVDGDGKIVYKDLMNFINYKKNPAPNIPPVNIPNMMSVVANQRHYSSHIVEFVQIEKLLQDTNLEKELLQQSS